MNDILSVMKQAIEDGIPGSVAQVDGGGGHFSIDVVAEAFAGKPMIQKHRLVLRTIKHLMDGPNAPVHAIDALNARTP